jgi:hypothetical protein
VQSSRGSLGIGFQQWDLVKTSPAILAVQWDPVPDEKSFRYFRNSASQMGVPFAKEPTDFKGGLGFGVVERAGVATIKAVVIPYWFVLACAAMWPAFSVMRRMRRWRWKRTGRCAACGYDLRGGGERCPECGQEVVRVPRASCV